MLTINNFEYLIISFTRERVRKMLEFITVEPASDAEQERGHSIPFHSDMIFQYNKAVINAKFFQSETQEALRTNAMSVEKKESPQQMIDIFMTPT